MKKILICGILTFLIIISCHSIVAAESTVTEGMPKTLLNIYQKDNTTAVGLKQKTWSRLYLSSDIEYVASSNDLAVQIGAVYFIPYNVDLGVFFGQLIGFDIYLYPGAGLQYFRNTGEKYAYLVLGIKYLIFFSESIYPFQPGEKPELRTGLSFNL